MLIITKIGWSIVIAVILLGSLTFQIKTKFKLLNLKKIIKLIKVKEKKDSNSITPFATLMVTLGGKIGVGSIAGIALAIYYGGVGSLFWLMVITLFCGVLAYVETVLGMKYRILNNGNYYGGPSYYIKRGLHNYRLAIVYSVLVIICYIGGFLAIQTNTITKSLSSIVFIQPYIVGIILVIMTSFCIIGGLKSISKVSEKLVPFMMIFYLFLALLVLLRNFSSIPQVLELFIKEAFAGDALKGGLLGSIIIGIQRGIFSTEIGIGTGSMVASTSSTNDIKKQASMQVIGVYITGILICSATAIFILFSPYQSLVFEDFNGIELVNFAFLHHFGDVGSILLLAFIFLFSFSTILTGYYYGEISFQFLFQKKYYKYLLPLKIVTLINVFLGCILKSTLLWKIVDFLVALLIFINIYSLLKLKDKINYDL